MLTQSDKPKVLDQFHLSAGSITGRRHVGSGNLLAGKNNQDAYCCRIVNDCLVLAVFDGCSSEPHSEFGARLGASLLPAVITEVMDGSPSLGIEQPEFWQELSKQMLCRMNAIARLCSSAGTTAQPVQVPLETPTADRVSQAEPDYSHFVKRHLLFTTLVAIISSELTVIAGIGDGVFSINQELGRIGPFPDNAPSYLANCLITPLSVNSFSIHSVVPTCQLESLILGTDGVLDLIESAEKFLPGKSRKVGGLGELLQQQVLFTAARNVTTESIDTLTGWLRLINSEVVQLHDTGEGAPVLKRNEGLLPDDTTLIALLRNGGQDSD